MCVCILRNVEALAVVEQDPQQMLESARTQPCNRKKSLGLLLLSDLKNKRRNKATVFERRF